MNNDTELMPTPLWLTDADVPAPCPCGRPPVVGEPLMMAEGETGLKRWMHYSCVQSMMGLEDDDE